MSAPRVFDDVSDTARWVAYYRALETERPDALFRDRLARRLAGERGMAIAKAMPAGPLPWAIAVRTRVYDELILEAIERDDITAVVNLAAGMDARPYRLSLPPSLLWVEVDLPDIIAKKTAALAAEKPSCSLVRSGLDLTDRAASSACLARVAADHSRVLVVTEGLLAYLDEPAVKALACDLHACPAVVSWVLETAAPEILARNRRAWGQQLESAGAEMKFAPANGLDFFRDFGWEPRVQRSCMLEAQRLGREVRFARLLRAVKSLTRAGRDWLKNVVVYGVVARRD
jgi:methyltransferase (TIGR00027 family)